MTDTYIDVTHPDQNFNAGSESNFLRLYPNLSNCQSALMRFDLAMLPAGSTIVTATLDIYIQGRNNNNSLLADVYRVLRNWDPASATWNRANATSNWQSAGVNGALDRSFTSEGLLWLDQVPDTWVSVDLTGLVHYWVNNPSQNYGLVFLGRAGGGVQYVLRSSDYPVSKAYTRPKLTIFYR